MATQASAHDTQSEDLSETVAVTAAAIVQIFAAAKETGMPQGVVEKALETVTGVARAENFRIGSSQGIIRGGC